MSAEQPWVRALPEEELPSGTRKVVQIGTESVLLVRHEGSVFAMDRHCPHMHGPLEKGTITEDGAILLGDKTVFRFP